MNKKTLITKILKFIYKANIIYKKSSLGDILLLAFISIMIGAGKTEAFLAILIIITLRGIYECDILKRLGVINEEENNKTNDEEIIENIR